MIAQTMFAAAFSIIDEARGDGRALSVLRLVHPKPYDMPTTSPPWRFC